jgi:hypothetical protein
MNHYLIRIYFIINQFQNYANSNYFDHRLNHLLNRYDPHCWALHLINLFLLINLNYQIIVLLVM